MAKATKPAAADKPARPAARAKAVGAPKKAGAAPKAAPAPITGPVEGGVMKPKLLLERVLARSGAGRAAAKPVIDAMLIELGEALRRGETLALPGLGKIKVKTPKEGAKGPGIVLKLLPMAEGAAKKDAAAPLASDQD